MTNTETTTVPATVDGSTADTSKPVGAKARKAATKPSKPVVTKAKKATKAAAKKAAKPAAKKAAKPSKAKGAPVVGNVIPKEYRSQYERSKIEFKTKDEDGKTVTKSKSVIDNGDDVASMLRGQPLDKVYALVAKKVGISEGDLRSRYSHLNVGMQRMNLGNKLRAALAE